MSVDPNRSSPVSDESSPVQTTGLYATTTRSPWAFALIATLVLVTFFVVQRLLFPTGTGDRDVQWTEWDVVTAAGETVEAKHLWLRDAFSRVVSSSTAEPADTDLSLVDVPEPLIHLMGRLTHGSQAGTRTVLLDLISWEFYLATVRECHFFDSSIPSSQLETWSMEWTVYPWVWSQYRVLHWERYKDHFARALILLADNDGHFHETRWWFVVRDGRWLIYDWEILDFGIRETTEAALAWTLYETPELLAYQDLLVASREDPALFDRELQIPAPLHDSLYVQLAYDYWERQQWEVALRMAERVKRPELTLGGLIAKAKAEVSLERFADATKTVDQLESLIGQSVHVRELRAAIREDQ